MSKLAAVIPSILGGLVAGGALVYALHPCSNPAPDDGNPIGFRLDATRSTVTPASGWAPSASALETCSKTQTCVVRIYLRTAKLGTSAPTADPCATGSICIAFSAPVSASAAVPASASSVDWSNTPHPDPSYSPERIQAVGTISISAH